MPCIINQIEESTNCYLSFHCIFCIIKANSSKMLIIYLIYRSFLPWSGSETGWGEGVNASITLQYIKAASWPAAVTDLMTALLEMTQCLPTLTLARSPRIMASDWTMFCNTQTGSWLQPVLGSRSNLDRLWFMWPAPDKERNFFTQIKIKNTVLEKKFIFLL